MTDVPNESWRPHDEVSDLNHEAMQLVEEAGEQTRLQLISLAHRSVSLFLDRDIDALERLQGDQPATSADIYVLDDLLSSPASSGQFGRALSLQLVLHGQLIRQGKLQSSALEQMKLYIPVPADFNYLADEVEVPDEIYIERSYGETGEVKRYAITQRGIYVYEAAADGGQDKEFDDFSLEVIAHRAMSRVSTGLPLLGRLLEDFTNMDTVPQRTIHRQSDDSA